MDTTTTSALAAESLRLSALCKTTLKASIAAAAELRAQIGDEHYQLVMQYVEGPSDNHHDAWVNLIRAEVMRHLPGFAPALAVLFDHVMDGCDCDPGQCCEPVA